MDPLASTSAHQQDVQSSQTVPQQEIADPTRRAPIVRVQGVERNAKDVWIKLAAASSSSNATRNVSRSLTEFAALFDALATRNPHVIVPALPSAQTSAATDEEEDRLVRAAYSRWMDRTLRNEHLASDDELRMFLESHFGYTPQATHRRAKAASTKFKRSGDVEEDRLAEAAHDMRRLETAYADVARATDKEARLRRAHAASLNEMAEQLNALATTEGHSPLAAGVARLSACVRRAGELSNVLAVAESVALGDGLAYAAAECREAKDTLDRRQTIVEEHATAVRTTIAKKRTIERLKASTSIKADRADDALDEFEEAKKAEMTLGRRVAAVSARLAPSLDSHIVDAHAHLLEVLAQHARAGLACERQYQRDLLALRPELLSITSRPAAEIYNVRSAAPMRAPSEVNSAPGSSIAPQSPRASRIIDQPASPSRRSATPHRPEAWPAVYSPPSSPITAQSQPALHSQGASVARESRINDLARSVTLTRPSDSKPSSTADRTRVNSRAAAQRLANFL